MNTTRELLGLIIRLGIALAFVTLIWFILTLIFPELSFKSMFAPVFSTNASTTVKTKKSVDWLPAPRNYFNNLNGTASTTAPQVYVPGKPYDGSSNVYVNPNMNQPSSGGHSSQYNYLVYTNSGAMIQKSDGSLTPYFASTTAAPTVDIPTTNVAQPVVVTVQDGDIRRLYLRSLTIYERGRISKNYKFTGEAREVMFDKNGKFPLVVIDSRGKIGVIGFAEASGNWAIPGWVRFEGTIQATLPKNVPCTLVFESGTIQPSTGKPLRFPLSVTCMN